MSPEPTPAEREERFAPDDISTRSFNTAFRGFDPVQVRAFLGELADELRDLQLRVSTGSGELDPAALEELAAREAAVAARELAVAAVESSATTSAAEAEGRTADAMEQAAQLVDRAKEEAASIVESARREADQQLKDARDRVGQLAEAAAAESQRVLEQARTKAQSAARAATEEAEATAVKKLADAEREAAARRVQARTDADEIIEAAKERGREMIAETQAARERLIADINKRKRVATTQLEQLQRSRDRLLESIRVVRRNIDEITTRLEATEGTAAPTADTPQAVRIRSRGTDPDTGAGADAVASDPVVRGETPAPNPTPPRSSHIVIGEAPLDRPRPASVTPPQRDAAAGDAPAPAPTTIVSTPSGAGRRPPVSRINTPQARQPSAVAGGEDNGGGSESSADSTPPAVSAPPVEERRSSALRILRRKSPKETAAATAPPQIGRNAPDEGIRVIRDEPAFEAFDRDADGAGDMVGADQVVDVSDEVDLRDTVEADAEEDAPATAPEDADPVEPEDADVDADADAAVDVVVDADVAAVELTSAGDEARREAGDGREGEAGHTDMPPPLLPEEVRPRIEDLFARIRADREGSVARARDVLSEANGSQEDEGDAGMDEPPVEDVAAPADGDEHLLQARDVLLEPLVGQLARRLKRAIQDEQNATLDRLRTTRTGMGASDLLPAVEMQPAPYRYNALPLLEESARRAAAQAPHGSVAVGVDDLAQALATELAGQIRSKVERGLASAVSDDLDPATISERVSAVYREWKTARIERLAAHFLVAAWSRGTFVSTPEQTPLRWIVDDEGPCPDCDDNALAGPVGRGDAFPTGQLHPPAHPGCRCLLVIAQG